MYDVIIVGGGVTGSIASQQLSKMGYRVLLAEKSEMPREKSCSGMLIEKAIRLVQSYVNTDIPHSVTCEPRQNKGLIFYDEQGKIYKFEQNALNIWRDRFDHWLLIKSEEAGTEIRQNTTVLSCEDMSDHVNVQMQKGGDVFTETAHIVIVCTGAISPIRDRLLGNSMKYVTTYQQFLHGNINLDSHYFYAFMGQNLSGYDAWFNVKDDYLIFGVADTDASNVDNHYVNFAAYMAEHFNAKVRETGKAERWVMPSIIPGCPLHFGKGRILFAGEAAGFLNPMGEGISCGVESAYTAAYSIQQTFPKGKGVNEDDLLKAYVANTRNLHSYMKRQWAFVGGISSTFSHMKKKALMEQKKF